MSACHQFLFPDELPVSVDSASSTTIVPVSEQTPQPDPGTSAIIRYGKTSAHRQRELENVIPIQ
jgi:hypothetical protein